MIVLLIIFIIVFLIALNEKNNSLWAELSVRYAIEWKYIKWNRTATLYFWKGKDRINWFNHVLIDINKEGVAVYFPFFKRYLPSILIPWRDIEVKDKAINDFTPKLRFMERLQLSIVDTDIQLTIPFRYMSEIKNEKSQYEK